MARLNDRCFCYFTAAMSVSLRRGPTWRLHSKLYKYGWSTLPNNVRMDNRTDLNRCEVVYISIIFHIPAFWLNLLNGYYFFDGMTLQPSHTSEVQYYVYIYGLMHSSHRDLMITHSALKTERWLLWQVLFLWYNDIYSTLRRHLAHVQKRKNELAVTRS